MRLVIQRRWSARLQSSPPLTNRFSLNSKMSGCKTLILLAGNIPIQNFYFLFRPLAYLISSERGPSY